MAIQGSGAISFSDIQTEFGGSNPISMSEYYAGGANVPSGTGSVPTSGAINLTIFYGTSNRVSITLTLTGNNLRYNIFNNRGGTYSAGNTDVTLVNNGNIYSGTATAALDTGTGWTAGDTITIDNNSNIIGHGGNGGAGGGGTNTVQAGGAGGAGSTAIQLRFNTTINNSGGIISGGSGGGGGGGSARSTGSNKGGSFSAIAGGGGGGAGRASASGGAGGNVTFTGSGSQSDGAGGGSSTSTNRGLGGARGSTSFSGVTATGGHGGPGGANSASAGTAGATAATGSQKGAGGTGGAAGKAINLNGNSVTYTAIGTIYGAVS